MQRQRRLGVPPAWLASNNRRRAFALHQTAEHRAHGRQTQPTFDLRSWHDHRRYCLRRVNPRIAPSRSRQGFSSVADEVARNDEHEPDALYFLGAQPSTADAWRVPVKKAHNVCMRVSGNWVLLEASRIGEHPSKSFDASSGGSRDALPESPCRSTMIIVDPALPIQNQRRTFS